MKKQCNQEQQLFHKDLCAVLRNDRTNNPQQIREDGEHDSLLPPAGLVPMIF